MNRRTSSTDPVVKTILHVRIDEPGGGEAHVGLLMRKLPSSWNSVEFAIPRAWTKGPIGWLRATRALAPEARDADLVHAHGIRAGLHTALAKRLLGCPIVMTVHGFHAIHRARWKTPAVWATRWILRRSARFLVLSDDDMELLKIHRLAPLHRVREVPPLFEPPDVPDRKAARRSLGIEDGEKAVLWIGRLEQEKDPMTFVNALCHAPDRVVGVIVGDGSLRSRVADACEPCSSRFIFTGWLSDPAAAYAAADVYVNTSLWEVGPLTAFEAASAGVPLILSDCPGAAGRLLAHAGPLRFAPGNEHELRDLLHTFFEIPRSARSSRILSQLPELSPEAVVAQIASVYDEVLEDARSRPQRATDTL